MVTRLNKANFEDLDDNQFELYGVTEELEAEIANHDKLIEKNISDIMDIQEKDTEQDEKIDSMNNSIGNIISKLPLYLKTGRSNLAKFPTSEDDLYSGPVTGLSALSLPINNADGDQGFWIDFFYDSRVISAVIYNGNDSQAHACIIGLDNAFTPIGSWIDLTDKGGGGSSDISIDFDMIVDDAYEFKMMRNYFVCYLETLSSQHLGYQKSGITVEDSTTTFDEVCYLHTVFKFDLSSMIPSDSIYTGIQKLMKYRVPFVGGSAPMIRAYEMAYDSTPNYWTSSNSVVMTKESDTEIDIEFEAVLNFATSTEATTFASACQTKNVYYHLNSVPFIREVA